jgi:uncharacterized phage protein (TIGR01671 family)
MKIENIKFKAKRLDEKGWVEGSLIRSNAGIKERAYIVDSFSSMSDYSVIGVGPSTVCQFTGLKDTNDVPIFEGDIIDFDGEGEVVFKDGAFYAKFGKYTECLLCNLVKSGLSVTIVGNKFDKEK